MSRTTWSLTEEAATRLEDVADRKENESVTQFIQRVADEFEASDGVDVTERNGTPEDALTVDHIDDIANEAASRTLRELEDTFRGLRN